MEIRIEKQFLNEKSVCELFDLSKWTLRHWRQTNKGPDYVKLENGRVRYPREKVIEWWERQIEYSFEENQGTTENREIKKNDSTDSQ